MKEICMKDLPYNLQLSLWFANMFASGIAPAFIQTSLMSTASNASGHCQRNSCITKSSNGYNEIRSMTEHLTLQRDISQMRNPSSWSICLPNFGQSDMPFDHLSPPDVWVDFPMSVCADSEVCTPSPDIFTQCGKLGPSDLKNLNFPHACMMHRLSH